MKLTIVQTGAVPAHLRDRFVDYPQMFRDMFASADGAFTYEDVDAQGGSRLPDPETLDGIVITGSPAGVYEDHAWLEPLRNFIRRGFEVRTPMLGICFGHQIMADALGGQVEKSPKGWGLGRHRYRVASRPEFFSDLPDRVAIACSHQDQVIALPAAAEVILSSDFAPNAGLLYRGGRALSFQPHPEFDDAYARALVDLRRAQAPLGTIQDADASFATASDSMALRRAIVRFFTDAAAALPSCGSSA